MSSLISNSINTLISSFKLDTFPKSGFLKYFKNIQWITISKVITLILSFVTTLIVARVLGPEKFGVLNYTISIVGIFAIIANLGVDNIVYKEITKNKESREQILGSSIILKLLTGLIAILLLSVSLFFLNETTYIKFLILLLSISFLTQPFTLLSYDFLKDKESFYVSIAQTVTSFVSSIFKIVITIVTGNLFYFLIILIMENILIGAIYTFQIKKFKNRSITLKPTRKMILQITALSLPLVFYNAFDQIYSRIDQVMLRSYVDTKAVGLYSAAVRLTEVWYIIPNILITSLFPALIHSAPTQNEYRKRIKIFTTALLSFGLIISTITFFLGKYIILILYGAEFIDTTPLLSVYIFSLIGSFLSILIFQDLFINNKYKTLILIPGLIAVLNVVLNVILIPQKGSLGAALATVISYNLIPIIYFLLRNKVYKQKNIE